VIFRSYVQKVVTNDMDLGLSNVVFDHFRQWGSARHPADK